MRAFQIKGLGFFEDWSGVFKGGRSGVLQTLVRLTLCPLIYFSLICLFAGRSLTPCRSTGDDCSGGVRGLGVCVRDTSGPTDPFLLR